MNTHSLIKIPGYKYNEYLVVLSLPQHLEEKITEEKEKFALNYKTERARYLKSHIALVNFIQFEMVEERLVNRLNTIAMGYQAFKVSLKGYGNFPSHTIFIQIESQQQLQNLVKAIKPAQSLMTLNKDSKAHFMSDFYLTVGRKLLPCQFEKAWEEYSHRHFTGCFIADRMLLLKRPVQEKKYRIVQQFEFMNLPVNAKQGELFI